MTNTNRIYYYSLAIITVTKLKILRLPTNYGGWIHEDGYVQYSFNDAPLQYKMYRYRFQNIGDTKQYLNNHDSTTLTCSTNYSSNGNIFHLYKLQNIDLGSLAINWDGLIGKGRSLIDCSNIDRVDILIKNTKDNKWLNHIGGTLEVNAIGMTNNDAGNYSKWNLLKQSDGNYVIKNVASQLYIECDSTNTSQIYCRSQIINDYSKWRILEAGFTIKYV
jgi:hypothetical protein